MQKNPIENDRKFATTKNIGKSRKPEMVTKIDKNFKNIQNKTIGSNHQTTEYLKI